MFPTMTDGTFTYKEICTSIWDCSWNFLNYGLRYGGGIGDIMMNIPYNDQKNWVIKKQFFDFIFFILINVLFMNMFSGIIIDTFAELRIIND